MLETLVSGQEIEPVIFQKDSERHLGLMLVMAANALEAADVVVRHHDSFNIEDEKAALLADIEDEGGEVAEAVEEFTEKMGDSFMNMALYVSGGDKPPVTEEEYDKATDQKSEARTILIDYTYGYFAYMRSNLAAAYGAEEGVEEAAWKATWKKVQGILIEGEGTELAEAADFFDGLFRDHFGKDFRPMETGRGEAVQEDTCARTFYEVMEDHVHRAIIGSTRDEWTGYQ